MEPGGRGRNPEWVVAKGCGSMNAEQPSLRQHRKM